MMQPSKPAKNPEEYVKRLRGWCRQTVEALGSAVASVKDLEETIKWGHVVYFANGPVLFIRAEKDRVLFGFWRGQRLVEIEPRLKGGGKYEMATLELRERDSIKTSVAHRLASEAVALNKRLGDPTKLAKGPCEPPERSF